MQLKKPSLHLIMCTAIAAVLSGCAATKTTSGYYQPRVPSVKFVSVPVASQLAASSAGQQLMLDSSPLGNNISATVVERYFAASGRDCVRLAPESASGQPLIACRQNDNQWFWNRSFSQSDLIQE